MAMKDVSSRFVYGTVFKDLTWCPPFQYTNIPNDCDRIDSNGLQEDTMFWKQPKGRAKPHPKSTNAQHIHHARDNLISFQ
mmetsp:Transcript_16527/g.24116  ORF Transcript_16527/g.24116 Transcript_16527/m.24116 type:complete len:80 (+) Transcript_16527:455-694(+)